MLLARSAVSVLAIVKNGRPYFISKGKTK